MDNLKAGQVVEFGDGIKFSIKEIVIWMRQPVILFNRSGGIQGNGESEISYTTFCMWVTAAMADGITVTVDGEPQ